MKVGIHSDVLSQLPVGGLIQASEGRSRYYLRPYAIRQAAVETVVTRVVARLTGPEEVHQLIYLGRIHQRIIATDPNHRIGGELLYGAAEPLEHVLLVSSKHGDIQLVGDGHQRVIGSLV